MNFHELDDQPAHPFNNVTLLFPDQAPWLETKILHLNAIAVAAVFPVVLIIRRTSSSPSFIRILPNGDEAWHQVAVAYKAESGEHKLCMEEDLRNNWVRKLYYNFKKPRGSTGDITNWIHQCIEIEKHIQHQSNSGILGASLAKSSDNSHLLQDDTSGNSMNNPNDTQAEVDVQPTNQGEGGGSPSYS